MLLPSIGFWILDLPVSFYFLSFYSGFLTLKQLRIQILKASFILEILVVSCSTALAFYFNPVGMKESFWVSTGLFSYCAWTMGEYGNNLGDITLSVILLLLFSVYSSLSILKGAFYLTVFTILLNFTPEMYKDHSTELSSIVFNSLILREFYSPSPGSPFLYFGVYYKSLTLLALSLIYLIIYKFLVPFSIYFKQEQDIMLELVNLFLVPVIFLKAIRFPINSIYPLLLVISLFVGYSKLPCICERFKIFVFMLYFFSCLYIEFLIQTPGISTWYSLNHSNQFATCAALSISRKGHWISENSEDSLIFTHGYQSEETLTCLTSFPIDIKTWRNKKVLVAGDSVGRFIFYSLVNIIADSRYGFPQAKFHKDIKVAEELQFTWSPFVQNLQSSIANNTCDILIITCGLWDKLWKRDVLKYTQDILHFIEDLNKKKHAPLLFWIEMTPVQTENLYGSEKALYLKEDTAEEWRRAAQASLLNYHGKYLYIPTNEIGEILDYLTRASLEIRCVTFVASSNIAHFIGLLIFGSGSLFFWFIVRAITRLLCHQQK